MNLSDEKSPLLVPLDEPVVPIVATATREKEAGTISSLKFANHKDVNWTKLSNLQRLYDEGFLTVTDFKERKSQLVDNLTGTSSRSTTASTAGNLLPSTSSHT
jgi:hypothetical protein